jgi:3-hydroxyisobutyrate dehydrogenase-like beta-hydroxyacid dehydrogenase
MSTQQNVGFIGLGRMGGAFTRRLHHAGHKLSVWNRTPAKAAPFAELGVRVAEEIQDLVGNDVVFTAVMADPDLLEVTVGPNGLLTRADSVTPALLIDLSTVSTAASAQVREACDARGVRFLAAPVSGNHEAVLAGRAAFAVSGPRPVFEAALPLFEQLGRGASYVGEGEVARLVKLSHNLFVAAVMEALVEALVLAEKGGIKRSAFLEFINASAIGSMFTKYKAPTLVNLDYDPRFTVTGLLKDVDLGMNEARRLGVPLPVIGQVRPLLQSLIGHGWAADDFNRFLDLEALGAGLPLESENLQVDNGLGGPAA